MPIVQEGTKAYRFRVRWGEESATDDSEGEIVARSDCRPSAAEIAALLPRFVGLIEQTPPTYSAIKIGGARAYDLARDGESFSIAARPIRVYRLDLVCAEPGLGVAGGRVREGRLYPGDRARSRPRARMLRPRGRTQADACRPVLGRCGGSARPIAGRRRSDGARHAASCRRVWRNSHPCPSTATARRSYGAGSRFCCAAPAPPAGLAWAACFGTPVAFGVVEDGYFVSTRVFNIKAIGLTSRRRTPFPASLGRPPTSGTRAWRSGRR